MSSPPPPAAIARDNPPVGRQGTWRTALAVPLTMLALYLVAAILLLVRLDAHPAYAYNWEEYTAYGVFAFWDRATPGILRLTGGLMTDSSFSPLVVLPSWLLFKLAGVGLWSLRVATALQAALAVPLLWWTGRHFVGPRAALLASALLALSPVFLLYGRTATLVGLSLGPALATIEALRRVWHNPADRRWLYALQGLLILNSYCYAPIRFLWPLAVGILGFAYFCDQCRPQPLRRALLVTILVPWLAIAALSLRDPFSAVVLYFEGRGEQVLSLTFSTDLYGAYIRDSTPNGAGGNIITLAARLLAQNVGDFGRLLLDRDTVPVLNDFSSPRGRLYPGFLAPLLALGLVQCAIHARNRIEDRLLLALALLWTLPLLITSKVHAGRLIFFLPILCLLVAGGTHRWLDWLHRRLQRPLTARQFSFMPSIIACCLVGAVALTTWHDYRLAPPLPHDAVIAQFLRTSAVNNPAGIALMLRPVEGDDPTKGVGEATQVATLRLWLDATYRFVYLPPGESLPSTPPTAPPPLYYGSVLANLNAPGDDGLPCDLTYYVARSALAQFEASLDQRRAACGEPQYRTLP